MTARTRGKKKIREGTVISARMQKTVVVDVDRVYRHPLYSKVVRSRSRCYVHDEQGQARAGDRVRILECRPLSKRVRWRLVDVVKKGSDIEPSGARAASEEAMEVLAGPEKEDERQEEGASDAVEGDQGR